MNFSNLVSSVRSTKDFSVRRSITYFYVNRIEKHRYTMNYMLHRCTLILCRIQKNIHNDSVISRRPSLPLHSLSPRYRKTSYEAKYHREVCNDFWPDKQIKTIIPRCYEHRVDRTWQLHCELKKKCKIKNTTNIFFQAAWWISLLSTAIGEYLFLRRLLSDYDKLRETRWSRTTRNIE